MSDVNSVPYRPPYWVSNRFHRFFGELFGYKDHWLKGEIKIGDRFIWEPFKPHARCEIEVTGITFNGDEYWIACKGGGSVCYNPDDRFREACHRIEPESSQVGQQSSVTIAATSSGAQQSKRHGRSGVE